MALMVSRASVVHELRHVCASLLIASGPSDMNIYGHLFAQDRTLILDAVNQEVSRLNAYKKG